MVDSWLVALCLAYGMYFDPDAGTCINGPKFGAVQDRSISAAVASRYNSEENY